MLSELLLSLHLVSVDETHTIPGLLDEVVWIKTGIGSKYIIYGSGKIIFGPIGRKRVPRASP